MESRRGTAKPTHRHGSDRHCVAVLTSVELTPKNSSLFSTDVFVLFHRGLLLNDPQDDVCCDDAASFHAASIALTYNVGLAHHLSGIEKGDLTLLSRALDFYLLAYVSMVDKEGVENSMKSSLALGMLALANNIGHIHATFCNFSRTNLCSEEILLRLVQLQDSQPGPSRHISKDEYKIFLLNASFFVSFYTLAPQQREQVTSETEAKRNVDDSLFS